MSALRQVFSRCQKLYPAYACKQYNSIFRQLTQEVGYAPDNIPQLQDVNAFLQKSSGFSLRPVGGLLSARAFLGGEETIRRERSCSLAAYRCLQPTRDSRQYQRTV